MLKNILLNNQMITIISTSSAKHWNGIMIPKMIVASDERLNVVVEVLVSGGRGF